MRNLNVQQRRAQSYVAGIAILFAREQLIPGCVGDDKVGLFF
jgi:hypothetical protein